ncbi:protein PATRONUS 2 [Chenopodium quinoa]|uniref:Uncharacterized protein n=1 Tax=Chenopodium quinoa TaxID=63459 RepID=A0A803M086_CHEQI|nr:protein PATRONUS 2 [Chenopodium quinoa]
MTSFEPIIRMDENAFRAHEKIQQPRVGRKPLTDMTNSRKPTAKDKSSVKNISGFKAPEKVLQPNKIGRKPLGDLTNSKKPTAQEKSAKNNCTQSVSAAVKKEQVQSFALGEGFLHNHDECIKANRQSMSLDYFLETVALKRDSASVATPQHPELSKAANLELEIPMEIEEMEIETWDVCAPESPQAPKSPRSPDWSMDFHDLELSPLKLKESPVRRSLRI